MSITAELWGGSQDGRLVELPKPLSHLRLPVAPDLYPDYPVSEPRSSPAHLLAMTYRRHRERIDGVWVYTYEGIS